MPFVFIHLSELNQFGRIVPRTLGPSSFIFISECLFSLIPAFTFVFFLSLKYSFSEETTEKNFLGPSFFQLLICLNATKWAVEGTLDDVSYQRVKHVLPSCTDAMSMTALCACPWRQLCYFEQDNSSLFPQTVNSDAGTIMLLWKNPCHLGEEGKVYLHGPFKCSRSAQSYCCMAA